MISTRLRGVVDAIEISLLSLPPHNIFSSFSFSISSEWEMQL